MEVLRTRLSKGARDAQGTVVIIDVFRAFSCAPLLFHSGIRKLILEASPEKAVALKQEHPEWILVGEVDEVPIKGGDMGNSPAHILQKGEGFFKGKTVIHRTTAGVTGATAALAGADEVLLGSFLVAKATADYIKTEKPGLVTLVAMGSRGLEPAPEDEACAEYIEGLLTGKAHDPVAALKDILFQPTTRKFLSGEKPYLPPEDPAICLQRDLFNRPIKARWEEDRITARPLRVS